MPNIRLGLRKVGKKGDGYCIMLPSVWIRNTEVHTGDRLQIEMRGRKLVLEPEVKQK
jgi:antitoxin component of MazEF toxin-antitoxin module